MKCVCCELRAVTHTFPDSPISNYDNNSVTNEQFQVLLLLFRLFFFFFALLQSTSHGDFSSAAFFKQRLWETEKVKQLTRCHLVNSLSLLFSHTSNSDGDPTRTLPSHPFSDFFSHVQFLASLINCLSSCAV